MKKYQIKRIYHHHNKWEDYLHGMYDDDLKNKMEILREAIVFFNNPKLVKEYMFRIIKLWKYSCEHNLTNNSMNKVAWLGQSACCLYCNATKDITIEAWNKLTPEIQQEANNIAEQTIKRWEECQRDI